MMFQRFDRTPKNPRHFISMCYREVRENPSLASSSGTYVRKRWERCQTAVFECAYGFFWATPDRRQSEVFFEDLQGAKAALLAR